MDHLMTTEDSYAERRQLFKNIWETAMNIEDKDGADILTKPKVIKTLRLDQVDRFGVGKKKKLKLKNLRTVCNKILDFCDKQEADDQFYEQLTKPQKTAHNIIANEKGQIPPKKTKTGRTKKKLKKSRSLYSPSRNPVARVTTSEGKDELSAEFVTSRNTSPLKVNRASGKKQPNKLLAKEKKNSAKSKKVTQGYLSRSSSTIVWP